MRCHYRVKLFRPFGVVNPRQRFGTLGGLGRAVSLSEQELLDTTTLAIARARVSAAGASEEVVQSWSDQDASVPGLGSDTPLNSPGNRAVCRNDRRTAAYHSKNGSGAPARRRRGRIESGAEGRAGRCSGVYQNLELSMVYGQKLECFEVS
ncbi:hypothetical protein CORC01_08468 [Colletotrichum orchidophilum]|uniref:Uncharacterized protein n=1 Tax=Colletotrichum orchidophilum TaxID=1209926 RepID=A0A1G4B492_9PEZI|nr:uncharacterized protein CORC01_08468 [Colletotrichum orchidophilum]OHE96250.1 hypothetical protein CORC01_08468 [Colletotrichum orchidophilum]